MNTERGGNDVVRDVGLRLLRKPLASRQILEQHDMASSFEYDIGISPVDGCPPPFVIDPPDFQ